MLIGIVRASGFTDSLPFVPKKHQRRLRLYLQVHRGLMAFFLLGYLAVMLAFASGHFLLSETFVSIIFLCGAVFVLVGVVVQSRLLDEVQETVRGILPICARCRKIRTANGNPKDPDAWKMMEAYVSEKMGIDLSHGYCPECLEEELQHIKKN